MDYKRNIADRLCTAEVSADDIYAALTVPAEAAMGDFALPCFKFAKTLRKSPPQIAEAFRAAAGDIPGIAAVEAVGGYLNFFVDKPGFIALTLTDILERGGGFGSGTEGAGKTVCLDYSSINIAKPFHIGHLSTTVIGAALCRIYAFLGYKTVGINHLGDWGTQFGKLIAAFKRWSSEAQVEKGGLDEMTRIYVRFHEEAEQNPALNDEARAWFKKIEDGDPEATAVFTLFKDMTLKEVDKIYTRLGVSFDSYDGESFFNDKMDAVVDALKAKGLMTVSEGASVVDLEPYGMPPCLILKADGATLYATRDIAAAFYRKKTYGFHKCLYVVAYQQNLHFKQFFKVIELMGCPWAADLEHVAFGMVSLEDGGTLSTRKGNVVRLKDVLDKCVEKAGALIAEKNPDLAGKAAIAETVGTGAVVFSALSKGRIKDIVFSYDRVLNFDGETGPYLQYTCVRCKSVLEKAGAFTPSPLYASPEGIEFETVKALSRFPDAVRAAAAENEPSNVTRLLLDIARSFNKFYYDFKIISDDKAQSAYRLTVVKSVLTVLENGLKLLGIGIPDKM